jgi:hypothetical protein
MRRRLGTAMRIGGVVAIGLLLTGCIKLNMNLQIQSDDTVSGTVQLGIQKELLELTGQSVEDLLGSDSPFPSDAPGVTVEPFDDGEFAGQQFTFDSVPIAQFSQEQSAEALSITRQGDQFVVEGVLDLAGGATAPIGSTGQDLLESADIQIAISFPGDVIEANGEIDGNTVTYAPEFGERVEISATGSAIDDGDEPAGGAVGGDDGGSNLMLILIIGAVVIGALIVLFLVLRNRSRSGGPEPAAEAMAGAPATTTPAAGAPTAPTSGPEGPAAPPGGSEPPPPPPPPPAPPPAEG